MAVSFCSPEEKGILAEIEKFLDKPITVLEITKTEYAETLDLTNEAGDKWKATMLEIENAEKWMKKKGKKK